MPISGRFIQEQQKAADRQAGRDTSSYSIVAYTAEAERTIKSLPTFTTYRSALQNNDGTLKATPLDDGTQNAGRYFIDSWGRYVSY